MRIWLDKTVDEEFEDLGTSGHTGTLNDRQFTFLATLGHTGSLADRMGSFIAGGRVVDTTAPVVVTSSYNNGTGALTLNITEASGSATCYWALVANPSTPTTAQVKAGTGGGILEAGSFTVTSGGDSDTISLTGPSGNELHLVIEDASGNNTGTPSAGNNTVITGVAFPSGLSIVQTAAMSPPGVFATTANFTLPSGITDGNELLMFILHGAPGTPTTPTGWTQVATGTGAYNVTYLYRKTASGDSSATVTSTNSTATGHAAVFYELSLPIGEIEVTFAASGVIDPPSHSPTGGSAEYIWISGSSKGQSLLTVTVAPSGYSNLLEGRSVTSSSNANQCVFGTASKIATAASDDPGVFTWSSASLDDGSFTLSAR